MKDKNTYIAEWLFFAQSDLKSAKASMRDGIYHIVCFHTQQTAEKSLKALLAAKGKIPAKTHDLIYLLKNLADYSLPEKFKEELNYLNQFYIPTRYPDAFPGSLPEGLPSQIDAQKAIDYAQKILDYVKNKIK